MKILEKYIFCLCLFLLAHQTLNANDILGTYEGKIKNILGYSNRKCEVKIGPGLENSYLLSFYGDEINTSFYLDKEISWSINNLVEHNLSEKIKATEGSRLNEGIGYKEALLSIDNGLLSRVSLHEEYLVFFGRKKEICGQLKKISEAN